MPVYRATRALMRLAAATACPTTVEGLEHLPRTGPVLLAGNHLAACDTFFLMAAVPRRLVFFGKREYFTAPGPRGRALAAYCGGLGFQPVDRRGGPAAARRFVATGATLLAAGAALAIYPEGTRSPDGRLHRGRPGTAGIALTTGAPLVPFGIAGTDLVQPIGTTLLRPHRVRIRFGRPLDYSALRDRPPRLDGAPATATLRELTTQLMHRIAELSEQPYVDAPAAPPLPVPR
ncbi:lysophospholipid acyltransferase family protein [Streptomyces millisiae]|uniref:Lysophospholipid acyltransferase family protein n=1 Tax=Streptomyces millisiae TaxID=3075542 RepID=A0ABU2LI20_9ACTN|nr:lysophospholipid acyltransferase family protein [Streptomyces sp. DSM 44918]MDT0316917.1 lysophospholipid acyltransferase family protein [Streptomyces sp. DSM 44918]